MATVFWNFIDYKSQIDQLKNELADYLNDIYVNDN